MNRLNIVLVFAMVLLFAACEYEPSGRNFVELTPPGDNIPAAITLNDVKPADTIYVYQNTLFTVKIKSTKGLLGAEVLMDGQVYANMGGDTFDFTIYPGQIAEGVHKLTVNAAFASGTGSLAEMMGMEGYKGELSWNICILPDLRDHSKLDYRINKDGFLEIYWNSIVPESIVEKYVVHPALTQKADSIIHDANQKSFVDYGYVCGYAYYEITTYLKDGYSFMENLSIDKPIPKFYFEDLGSDNLRVYWDKPFANGRFDLTCDNKIIAGGITDTTITIPQVFGTKRQFSLDFRPRRLGYDTSQNKYTAWNYFGQGVSLGLPNWELYAYNKKDNIIYTSMYNSLVAFDANSLQKINTVSMVGNPWGFAYGGKIASAPHNSSVAAMTGEETWIFKDSRFTNPIKIPSLPGDLHTRLSALTSNDRFFVVQKGSNVCKVFNALTGEEITEIPFTYKTIYDMPDFVTVSEDGQFFCASSENGIEVFKINGTVASLLHTDTKEYEGAMFVPSQPDKLLLLVGSNIEIRQMPGFGLIQSLDVSAKGATLCNIDPATLNLLYYQKDSLKVCKINNLAKTIFQLRSDQKTCKIFNNKLLTYGMTGMCFDISPYLSH